MRLLKFVFYSLVIHLVSIVIWQQREFGFGELPLGAINPVRIHSALLVTLSRPVAEKKIVIDTSVLIDKAIDVAKESISDELRFSQVLSEPGNNSEVYRSGQLTRVPTPIGNINLDADMVDIDLLQKKIVLTLVIGMSGLVETISAESEGVEQQEQLERVAARFKAVQFLPGQINGRVVRSQLVIVVVAEPVTYDYHGIEESTVSGEASGASYRSVVGE